MLTTELEEPIEGARLPRLNKELTLSLRLSEENKAKHLTGRKTCNLIRVCQEKALRKKIEAIDVNFVGRDGFKPFYPELARDTYEALRWFVNDFPAVKEYLSFVSTMQEARKRYEKELIDKEVEYRIQTEESPPKDIRRRVIADLKDEKKVYREKIRKLSRQKNIPRVVAMYEIGNRENSILPHLLGVPSQILAEHWFLNGMPDTSSVAVNGSVSNSPEKFQKEVDESIKSGFSPKWANDPKYILYHELGHFAFAVWEYQDEKGYNESPLMCRLYKMFRTRSKALISRIEECLGDLAFVDFSEFCAQLFVYEKFRGDRESLVPDLIPTLKEILGNKASENLNDNNLEATAD